MQDFTAISALVGGVLTTWTKLLLGAAIFGAGWGLGGYCPGPSIVSLASGAVPVVLFVLAMLGGMLITAKLETAWARRQTPRAVH